MALTEDSETAVSVSKWGDRVVQKYRRWRLYSVGRHPTNKMSVDDCYPMDFDKENARDWFSTIQENHKKGKEIHNAEIGNQADIFVMQMLISAVVFFPILAFGMPLLLGGNESLGMIIFLSYFALTLYGYYTILGFLNG